MKYFHASVTFLCLIATNLFASYSTDWIRPADNYQKTGAMIDRDNSDNVYVTGYIQSQNIYTRKYDRFGNFQWEKASGSGIAGNYEKSVWVNVEKGPTISRNGNVYVVGYRYTSSSSWEYPNAIVVLKYNTHGTLLWKKNINLSYVVGSSSGLAFNLKSELDGLSNLYIGTVGTSPSGFVLIKLDLQGNVLVNTSNNLNGVNSFASMRLKGNKVVLTGHSGNLLSAPVIAWDISGNLLWTAALTGQAGMDVEIDGNGNSYILTSYPNLVSPSSGQDAKIYKLNPGGAPIWNHDYNFGGSDFPTKFTLAGGKLSVIGFCSITTYFDWLTFQVDTAGTLLWDTKYNGTSGNDEAPYALTAKANGEVFVTGKGGPLFTQPNGSSYLRMVTLKYGNTGSMQWLDTLNIYSGWGIASTLATDSSLFVLSGTNITAFHFLDHTGTGSCGIPSGLTTASVIDTSAKFLWTPVAGAYLYHLRYKTLSASTWTSTSINTNSITIKTLVAGTTYEYAVEAICSSGPSGYTASQTVTTTGAGYCVTGGLSTAQEYLSLVWIGGIINQTGNDSGYGDFTNLSTTLQQGATINGYLSCYSNPVGQVENYSIWIDYNHNFDFSDPGEQVVNISSTFSGYIAVNFIVSPSAIPGTTRMRVKMDYDTILSPCGLYPRGETEDYTIVITTPAAGGNPLRISTENNAAFLQLFPNPASDFISFKNIDSSNGTIDAAVYNSYGQLILQLPLSENRLPLEGLPNGAYFIRIIQNNEVYASRFLIAK